MIYRRFASVQQLAHTHAEYNSEGGAGCRLCFPLSGIWMICVECVVSITRFFRVGSRSGLSLGNQDPGFFSRGLISDPINSHPDMQSYIVIDGKSNPVLLGMQYRLNK